MKVNVTTYAPGPSGQLYQEEFGDISGVSINPDDGELVLMNDDSVVLHVFEVDEWSAFAVQKED